LGGGFVPGFCPGLDGKTCLGKKDKKVLVEVGSMNKEGMVSSWKMGDA